MCVDSSRPPCSISGRRVETFRNPSCYSNISPFLPEVGSSKMHRVGEPVKARATLSLRFCPPDRFMDCVCSFSSSPTSRSFFVTSGLARQDDGGGGGVGVTACYSLTDTGRVSMRGGRMKPCCRIISLCFLFLERFSYMSDYYYCKHYERRSDKLSYNYYPPMDA